MLQMEEDRLTKQRKPAPSNTHTPSNPAILYSSTDKRDNTGNYNNYGGNNHGNNNNYRGRGRGGRNNRGRGRYNNWSPQSYQQPWSPMYTHAPWPPVQYRMVTPAYAPAYNQTYPPHQMMQPGILGQGPNKPQSEAHIVQPGLPSTATPPQKFLPASITHAFNTMALQDPHEVPWYMDSDATNHIASHAGNLRSVSNLSSLPTITVGNGSSAAVTTLGQGTIYSPSRSFHLKDVLVCPSIIKNLVSVRKFVTDNFCSIEFDPLGLCVKDLLTRTRLLRCNSPGPLYSVQPYHSSPTDYALAASATDGSLWHRRLGHPSNLYLSHILSSFSTLNNKTDLTKMCQPCQLGKHVRQPFYASNTSVEQPFDIIHSDI